MASNKHIALLRGINVGGKNKLSMVELVKLFSDAGCADVRTYIQSGNVVFAAPSRVVKGVSVDVSRAIEKRFGLWVPVVIRTAGELATVAKGNPFLKPKVEEDFLHVVFLAGIPKAEQVEALDPKRSPADGFKVIGRDIYLHLPNGVSGSKLTNAYFDSTLGTVSTIRNWRTVMKLLEMTK